MDRSKLKKLQKQRDNLIAQLNSRFEQLVAQSQRNLLALFLERFVFQLDTDENKLIKNTQANRNKILAVDKLFNEYAEINNPLLIGGLLSGVGAILDFNSKYYSNLEAESRLLPLRQRVRDNMSDWLGIKEGSVAKNGYLDTLIESSEVKAQVKAAAVKIVYGQQGFNAAKANVQELINGSPEKLGALQKYHRNFTYDLYSQVDRATAKTYADDLKFEFAIYEGGIIKTTRPFCREHNGNVYHRSEIAEMKPKKAIPPDYNPFTDMGGYACRHHWNWIPNSLAKMMRPDAARFLI